MNLRSVIHAAGYVALAATTALIVTPARAADGAYARLDVGAAFSGNTSGDIFNGTGFGNDFGTSPVVNFGVGAALPLSTGGVSFRGDVTAGYHPSFNGDHSAPNTNGTTVLSTQTNVRTWTAMANVYADFATGGPITPYVGVGAGVAFNHLGLLTYNFNGTASATETGTDKENFAWSGMVGLGYKMSEAATLDFGYRYLDTGNVQSSGVVTLGNGATSTQTPVRSKLHAHEVTIGIRYGF